MTKEPFKIIGISVRTTNENLQATIDIPALWSKFFTESIASRIPNKLNNDLYCVYTEYEKDHTKPYTTLLGYKVPVLEKAPEGMTETVIHPENYTVFTAKGNPAEGSVFKEWQTIWSSDIDRSYVADFEIYNAKSQDPENAEVDIYIGVK